MMTTELQIALNATPDTILAAWTDALPNWFAEYADVSIPEKRYDFWGDFTPGAPDRDGGRHPLLDYKAGKALKFSWRLGEEESVIEIGIYPREAQQIVVVRQEGSIPEDFWFLSLENLRRHLDGKPPVRCDYTQPMLGDIERTIEIDGAPEAVFDLLIKPEQLNRWIASNATVEPVVGGRYDYGWPNDTSLTKILELVPNQRLKIDLQHENEEIITWTLEGSGGKTRLTLVHSGFAPDQYTGDISTGWLNFMSWMKSIVEYGDSWQPAISRLNPEMQDYYAASLIKGQADLISG
jgi:uncharacterized protein YndB with AHSA1/START domain